MISRSGLDWWSDTKIIFTSTRLWSYVETLQPSLCT